MNESTATLRRPLESVFLSSMALLLGDRLKLDLPTREQHGASEAHFATMPPDAVAFSLKTEEIVTIVRLCGEHRVPIVPYGAVTALEGQLAAVAGGLTIDMSLMNRIIAVHTEDLDCTVEAGVTREQLNAHLRDMGLFFPIDPGANATIGGMASTRASGTNAVRYGTMRDVILSLRIVTPEGRDLRTGQRARKSAAGYDLTCLMIGAEGTLGIITEISLRLHPIPETISAAVCGFDRLADAVNTVIEAMQMSLPLARIELLDEVQMAAINLHSSLGHAELPTLFLEFHGSPGSPGSVAEDISNFRKIAEGHGGCDFSWSNLPEERSKLWAARHAAYYAGLGLRPRSVGWATDVCVPISRLAECILETRKDLDTTDIPTTIVGHVADGNFHVVFVPDPDNPEEEAEAHRLNARLIERALAMGGTCTGEHGIGLGKQEALLAEMGEGGVDMMRTIKRAIDPQGLLNPGKIFS
jgi:D-lactate dehydrogenase (cytochrome)